MLTLLCSVSLLYLASILIFSGVQNLELQTKKINFELNLLFKLAKSPTFSLINIVFGLLLMASPNSILIVAICVFAGAMITTGFYIEFKNPIQKCNCFGSMANKKRINFTLKVLGIASSILILVAITQGRTVRIHEYWWVNVLFALSVIAFIFAFRKLTHSSAATIHVEHRTLNAMDNTWDPAQVIGLNLNKQPFLMSSLAELPPLALIIVLSKQCDHCKEILPDIAAFSESFHGRLGIIVVFDEEPRSSECGKSLVLFDPDKSFYSRVDPEGTPFALLFYTKSIKQIAPVAYGSERIRILVALALNVIGRSGQDMRQQ